jgi:type I restriction enzyme S subunit
VKLPAYPKYKRSGVEWLGDLPEHWEVKRLRYLCSIRKGRLPAETFPSLNADRDLPYLSMEFLRGETDLPNFVATALGLVCAEAGDLLLLWDGSNAGEFLRAKRGVVSSTVARLETRNIEQGFLFYSCKALEPQIKDQTVGMGIPHVSGDELKSCSLPYPDPDEQRAIADFLDRETARLDTLVGKKRELIEKLKEKRTALISRTVTRGLNPNVKLKPSGVEWLGDIPQQWKVMAVRRIANRIQTGSTPPTAEESYYEDGTVPWFGPGSFGDSITLSDPVKLLNESAVKDGAARLFREGATIVVTIGATLGKVSSLAKGASCNQQITVIECNEHRVYPRFLTYQLKRLEPTLRAIAPSATLPILSQDEMARLFVALPFPSEQRAIAEYLDRETAKLDRMMEKVEAAIEKLQEYRTVLITAAVTGKIDVRAVDR